MKLAALGLTTDGSESLATDTSGSSFLLKTGEALQSPNPEPVPPWPRKLPHHAWGIQPAAGAEASRTNGRLATMVY